MDRVPHEATFKLISTKIATQRSNSVDFPPRSAWGTIKGLIFTGQIECKGGEITFASHEQKCEGNLNLTSRETFQLFEKTATGPDRQIQVVSWECTVHIEYPLKIEDASSILSPSAPEEERGNSRETMEKAKDDKKSIEEASQSNKL